MEIDSKLRENLATQQQQLQQQQKQPFFVHENYTMKPYMKDHDHHQFQFEAPSSKGLMFLQDFHHLDHQFHSNGQSSNHIFSDPFESTFQYGCSSTNNFEFYECKPLIDNNSNGGHGQVMDNFQSGGYLNNMTQRDSLDKNGSDQNQYHMNFQEVKPLNFVAADEVSSSVTADNGYLNKKVGMTKSKLLASSNKKSWKSRKKSNVVKGQWTIDEDRVLIKLVEQYGVRKWSHIAQMLPGRIGKQCRERWHNHLRPDIKKDTWSEEEDKVLIQAHAEIGNKWAEIAKRLPGRTENSIKNHWNATKRRQFSKRKCRSKYPRGSLLQDYIKSLNLDPSTTSSRSQQKASSVTIPNSISVSAPNLQPQMASDFCSTDRLVPNYDDFNEVPDFDFDEKILQESCSIDSLLDEMPCVPPVVDDQMEQKQAALPPPPPSLDLEVKKELDLMEMISQANL